MAMLLASRTFLAAAAVGLSLSACAADTFSGPGDAGAGPDAAPPCPNLSGLYDVSANGPACPTTIDSTVCVTQTGCTVTVDGQSLSATFPIGSDGKFANADVQEGPMSRSGCQGAWDGAASALAIDCGGTGTSQSCQVLLKRKSVTCN